MFRGSGVQTAAAVTGATVLAVAITLLAGRTAQVEPPGSPQPGNLTPVRTWVDDTGKHNIEAAFVEFKDGKVYMRTPSGSLKVVPLDRLSAADQEYVKQQTAPWKPAALLPRRERSSAGCWRRTFHTSA